MIIIQQNIQIPMPLPQATILSIQIGYFVHYTHQKDEGVSWLVSQIVGSLETLQWKYLPLDKS